MTKTQAKQLKLDDRVVIWPNDPAMRAAGKVVEVGYNARKIAWDDGQVGVIHLDDFANVVRESVAA